MKLSQRGRAPGARATGTDAAPRYWFRAKRYGWGWGLPCSWQGWVVLLGALLVMGVVQAVWDRAIASVVAVPVMGVVLAVAVRKGEPPRWRWGGR